MKNGKSLCVFQAAAPEVTNMICGIPRWMAFTWGGSTSRSYPIESRTIRLNEARFAPACGSEHGTLRNGHQLIKETKLS